MPLYFMEELTYDFLVGYWLSPEAILLGLSFISTHTPALFLRKPWFSGFPIRGAVPLSSSPPNLFKYQSPSKNKPCIFKSLL